MDFKEKNKKDSAYVDSRLKQSYYNSLSWLNTNLEYFSPISKDGNYDWFKLKCFAEFSLVYAFLKGNMKLPFNKHLLIWEKFLLNHCKERTFAMRAGNTYSGGNYFYILPYLMLRSAGHHFEYHDQIIKKLIKWGYFQSKELLPFRDLEIDYTLWKSGLITCEPDWEKWYKTTVLANFKHPLFFNKESAYAITHTIFYLTDFGNKLMPISHKEHKRVTEVVEYLLFHYWRIGNWDLTGELLISLNYLGKAESIIYKEAARVFRLNWNNTGYFPPNKEYQNLSTKENYEKDLIFKRCYHTTLVAVLYAASEIKVTCE